MRYFADMHSHFLINGYYLKRDFFGRHKSPRIYNPLKNYLDYEKAKKGGVNILTFTIYVPWSPLFWVKRSEVAFGMVRRFKEFLVKGKDKIEQAVTVQDIKRIVQDNKMAVVLAAEGGHILDHNIDNLRILKEAGLRMLTLTHFVTNDIADSCYGPRKTHGGLSKFGVDVVKAMNKLGIIVDVAHATDEAVLDVLDVSEAPIMASHSGMRALCDSPRNLPDALLKEIARRKGMVGIILWPPLLKCPGLRCDLDRWADHVVHAAEVAGPEAVGIGTDLDGYTWPPAGFKDASDYSKLIEVLEKRGFSSNELDLILGGNYLRVLEETQK